VRLPLVVFVAELWPQIYPAKVGERETVWIGIILFFCFPDSLIAVMDYVLFKVEHSAATLAMDIHEIEWLLGRGVFNRVNLYAVCFEHKSLILK
jgi:hypothetical protein